MVTSRLPSTEEVEILAGLLSDQREYYEANPEAAKELASVGDSALADRHEHSAIASWTVVASAVLNLHEAITKG
jgi:hypothetical protein